MKTKSIHLPKDNQKTVLLWISIIYASHWLNGLFLILTQDTPVKYLFMGFASPFILFMLLVFLLSVYNREIQKKVPFPIAMKFLIVPLIFIFIEAIHLPNSHTVFKKFRYIFYPEIISSSLEICLLVAIFELCLEKLKTQRFFHTLIKLLTLKTLIAIIIAEMAHADILPIKANEVIYNSGQAYESLTILLFLIFDKKISDNLRYKHFFVCMNALPMFIFLCRGATLIFSFVFIMYLIMICYRKTFINQRKTLVVMSCIFLLAMGYLFSGINVPRWGINVLRSQYRPSQLKGAEGRTQIKQLSSLISALLEKMKQKKLSDEIYIYNEYGNFVLSDSEISINDSTSSAYSRIGTILLAFKHFIKHPIIGRGSYSAHLIKVEGFGIHSLIPLILVSYGLAGFLPFILFCLYLIKTSMNAINNHFRIITYSCYVVLVMTFINGFVWWFSLIIILLYYSPPIVHSEEPNSTDIVVKTGYNSAHTTNQ